ncbi:c-type cytochrome [Iodidimonas sp. SYSU 1G8]|uniref:c-type cytochrome n=1 Tax=Iodidimonas sp. SYSU 1G8 TaxID=3133967 RepID=UPI0031FE8846
MKTAIALAIALTFAAGSAPAEEQALPPGTAPYPVAEKGADLAQIWCSACHVTGTAPAQTGMDTAPAFSKLAPAVAADPARYKTFLTRPHGPMREITLSRDEIDALLAYIQSLDETPAR